MTFLPRCASRRESPSRRLAGSLPAVSEVGPLQTNCPAAHPQWSRLLLFLQLSEAGPPEEGGLQKRRDAKVAAAQCGSMRLCCTFSLLLLACFAEQTVICFGHRLLRYDNRCRHLREQQVQEKLAQGLPHVIRFRLETGVEPFQDLVFGRTHHEVAQVVSFITSVIILSLTLFTECHLHKQCSGWHRCQTT